MFCQVTLDQISRFLSCEPKCHQSTQLNKHSSTKDTDLLVNELILLPEHTVAQWGRGKALDLR